MYTILLRPVIIFIGFNWQSHNSVLGLPHRHLLLNCDFILQIPSPHALASEKLKPLFLNLDFIFFSFFSYFIFKLYQCLDIVILRILLWSFLCRYYKLALRETEHSIFGGFYGCEYGLPVSLLSSCFWEVVGVVFWR